MDKSLNISVVSDQNVSNIIGQFNIFRERSSKKDFDFPLGKNLELFLAKKIDHTLLKPEATQDEVIKLCEEADKFDFASVCVMPSYITLCKDRIKSSNVKVCAVIGFPLGATITEVKKYEAQQSIKNGAQELDMVINIGRLKDGDYNYVFDDIAAITQLTKSVNIICKVIIETALLTDEEKVKACLIASDAGADFVKTSTGFSKGGATLEDVSLMKFVVGDKLLVKASGGIRSREDAMKMIANGADRLGTSSGVKIILGEQSTASY